MNDQEKALAFYTGTLGFVKKTEIPVGEFKWLTVVSPDEPDGTELVLEPDQNPAAKAYTSALFAQGIPITAFQVEDIQKEFERLSGLGVAFNMPPTQMGAVILAIFDDTCGNLIQSIRYKEGDRREPAYQWVGTAHEQLVAGSNQLCGESWMHV